MKNKTLIVLAHRLATIENSDKIVVVDQGKIVAEGTQTELMKSSPLYQHLWKETLAGAEQEGGDNND